MPAALTTKPKRFACTYDGCGKRFTRSDHLQRHYLNHKGGDNTCPRCNLHFKRPDLLGERTPRSKGTVRFLSNTGQKDILFVTKRKMKRLVAKDWEIFKPGKSFGVMPMVGSSRNVLLKMLTSNTPGRSSLKRQQTASMSRTIVSAKTPVSTSALPCCLHQGR